MAPASSERVDRLNPSLRPDERIVGQLETLYASRIAIDIHPPGTVRAHLLPYCFAVFLVFGSVLVLVGANQAELSGALGQGMAETSLLASVLSLGLGVGVVASGPLFDRYPRRRLFAGSTLLAGAALLGVAPGDGFWRWLVLMGLTGVGIGAYDNLINAVVAQHFGARSARPMSIMHSAASLGAILGPLLVGWLAVRFHWTASFTWIGAAHIALAVGALFVAFPAPETRPGGSSAGRSSDRVRWSELLPFAGVAFAYVGIEAAMTIVAVPYATLALELGAERGRLAISAFWLGLFLGRIGAVMLRRELDTGVLGTAGTLAALVVGAAAAVAAPVPELPFLAAGLALGCVYPVMISLAAQRFPHARGTAAGLAAGAGALGGFAVPWITGALGDAVGVTLAFGSLSLWAILMAVCAAAARRAG
jgi:fucose permease